MGVCVEGVRRRGGGGIDPLHSMEHENNLVFLIW